MYAIIVGILEHPHAVITWGILLVWARRRLMTWLRRHRNCYPAQYGRKGRQSGTGAPARDPRRPRRPVRRDPQSSRSARSKPRGHRADVGRHLRAQRPRTQENTHVDTLQRAAKGNFRCLIRRTPIAKTTAVHLRRSTTSPEMRRRVTLRRVTLRWFSVRVTLSRMTSRRSTTNKTWVDECEIDV